MVEKILISRCNRLMMVNGYPLPIGYLHFNRGKSASNHGIKSTHSLDEGDILGGKEVEGSVLVLKVITTGDWVDNIQKEKIQLPW